MLGCVEGRGGEATALAHAAVLSNAYGELTRNGKRQFLELISDELAADSENLAELAQAMLNASGDARRQAEDALRQALEAPWLHLLRYFNRLPDGTRFLVNVRADLLRFEIHDPGLVPLERDLKRLLQTWFDVGFSNSGASPGTRRPRCWSVSRARRPSTPWKAGTISRTASKSTGGSSRLSPQAAEDPLIFVEVALTRGMPREIGAVLGRRAQTVQPAEADTAVFLFDLQRRAWPRRYPVRRVPDPPRRRSAGERAAASATLRHDLANPRLPRMARGAAPENDAP